VRGDEGNNNNKTGKNKKQRQRATQAKQIAHIHKTQGGQKRDEHTTKKSTQAWETRIRDETD
jgi:hypothetical protein